MSIVVTMNQILKVVETLTVVDAQSGNAVITHDQFNVSATLNSGTPATEVGAFQKVMSSGAGTIDLRAMPSTNGRVVDGNGLKVQAIYFRNPSGNANDIAIVPGASNGYALFKGGGGINLAPGMSVLLYGPEKLTDIDATHKTIDISGTGAQALDCIFILG